MKLKFLITAICCLFFITQSFAQKKQNVYFLKNSGMIVSNIDSADFIRVVSEPDSGSTLYNVAEYYKNNKIKLSGKSSRVDPPWFEGACVSYYPSGKKKDLVNYKGGIREGDNYEFFKNGKLYVHKKVLSIEKANQGNVMTDDVLILDCADSTGKVIATDGNGYYIGYDDDFKHIYEEGEIKSGLKNGKWKGGYDHKTDKITFDEEYDNGNLISGKAVDGNNVTYNYNKRDVQPQFPGGLSAFGTYLGNNIKYPYGATTNRIQGIVLIKFVVQKDGSLTDFEVLRDPDIRLTAEALRVLKKSPNWLPGVQYGRPVRVSYTVPVNFKL